MKPSEEISLLIVALELPMGADEAYPITIHLLAAYEVAKRMEKEKTK